MIRSSASSTLTLPNLIGIALTDLQCMLSADQFARVGAALLQARPADPRAVCFIGGALSTLAGARPAMQQVVALDGDLGDDPFLVIAGPQGAVVLLAVEQATGFQARIFTDPDLVDRAALVLSQFSDANYSLDALCDPEAQRALVGSIARSLCSEPGLAGVALDALLPDERPWLELARTLTPLQAPDTILSVPTLQRMLHEAGFRTLLAGSLDADLRHLHVIASAGAPVPTPTIPLPNPLIGALRAQRLSSLTPADTATLGAPLAGWAAGQALTAVPLLRERRVWGLLLALSERSPTAAARALISGVGAVIAEALASAPVNQLVDTAEQALASSVSATPVSPAPNMTGLAARLSGAARKSSPPAAPVTPSAPAAVPSARPAAAPLSNMPPLPGAAPNAAAGGVGSAPPLPGMPPRPTPAPMGGMPPLPGGAPSTAGFGTPPMPGAPGSMGIPPRPNAAPQPEPVQTPAPQAVVPNGGRPLAAATPSAPSLAQRTIGLSRGADRINLDMRTLLEHLSDGVVVVDAQGRIVAFTSTARGMLALQADARGRSLVESGAWCLSPLFTEALLGELDGPREIELPAGRPAVADVIALDGGMWAFVLRMDSTQPAVPVTEAPSVVIPEQERNESFLMNFSNIIRMPLRELRELITQVPAAGNLNEQQSRLIGQVVRLNSELTMLVNDLLALGQIRLQTDEALAPLRLDLLVEAAVGTQYAEFGRRGQHVVTEIQPGLPRVQGSEEGLGRAVAALIDNAIKYSPAGAQIKVAVSHSQGEVIVSVHDNGLGLHEEELAQVFDPFYRAPSTEHLGVSGRGLGLTITKAVIEQHGGRTWATGAPGQGCAFAFSIPCD